MAYMFGVRTGSMPSRERRKTGVEAEIRVGRVECRKVATATEGGTIHDGRDLSVVVRERGGCVDGVSISRVRAISIGANMTPAIPAALTAVARLIKGFDDEVTSSPPTADGIDIRYGGVDWDIEMPGSGSARSAHKRERTKAVMVERRTLWIKVLLVPFQIPQAPSVDHKWDITWLIASVAGIWWELRVGRGLEGGDGEAEDGECEDRYRSFRRRWRFVEREGVWFKGAAEVK